MKQHVIFFSSITLRIYLMTLKQIKFCSLHLQSGLIAILTFFSHWDKNKETVNGYRFCSNEGIQYWIHYQTKPFCRGIGRWYRKGKGNIEGASAPKFWQQPFFMASFAILGGTSPPSTPIPGPMFWTHAIEWNTQKPINIMGGVNYVMCLYGN